MDPMLEVSVHCNMIMWIILWSCGRTSSALVAELFKALGSEPRLALIAQLVEQPMPVGELVDVAGMSQPLVSQHLRTLIR